MTRGRPPHGGRIVVATLVVACLLPGGALPAQMISPGPLTSAHASLEGMRNCTRCHELRSRGASDRLCLSCHTPVARRIEASEGYHGGLSDRTCSRCHKEHFGRDFTLVRWDPERFDHAETGTALSGAHRRLACRECHRPELVTDPAVRTWEVRNDPERSTWLGLPRACAGCHVADDPHLGQFAGRACDDCHGDEKWRGAGGLDHDQTAYPLRGAHRDVDCAGCHRPAPGRSPAGARYAGVPHDGCAVCHRDPHEGAMKGRCASCHGVSGWRTLDPGSVETGLDHAATGFRLDGAHARAPCRACHAPPEAAEIRLVWRPGETGKAYPAPVSDTCADCHRNAHEGDLASRGGEGRRSGADAVPPACDDCHGTEVWAPARFDVRRHNTGTGFRLDGAHLAVPCLLCHEPDPATADGPPRFRNRRTACGDCHAPDDPHADQFAARACASCHAESTFEILVFDHDRTRYPLDGRHADVPCASCHPSESRPEGGTFVRYRPLETACTACHGE